MIAAIIASPFFCAFLFCLLIGIFGQATFNGKPVYGAEAVRIKLGVCAISLLFLGVGCAIIALFN